MYLEWRGGRGPVGDRERDGLIFTELIIIMMTVLFGNDRWEELLDVRCVVCVRAL